MCTDSRSMAILNAVRIIYSRFMPHLLMILAQIGYLFLYTIAEAVFNHGMNPRVFATYRYIVGSLVMFPLAYFLERKARPKLTIVLFLEIFVLSLLGASLTINMYFASLKYTSPTFVASMNNTVLSMTFIIAIILRLEIVDLRNPRGIAKIVGTLLSLAGVLTITLYKGPEGVISCGLTVLIQLWCNKEREAVFLTMFSPLATVMVAILAYFLFGEELQAGSISRGVVIIGLHMLLWGKENERDRNKSQEPPLSTYDEEKLSQLAVESSAEHTSQTGS
ncbi:hypothetical protein D5086_011458 [Populus alba]|uniref:Uncharacterized protein n=1 Tax=Populus alba TaxID=43335 RepID=A0ACC4CDR8_POPAL